MFDACAGGADRTKAEPVSQPPEQLPEMQSVQSDSEYGSEYEKGARSHSVEKGDKWTNHQKNPDFNLIVIHASNEGFVAKMKKGQVGSYLSYFFAVKVKRNAKAGNAQNLGEIMDEIEGALHDSGKQLIRTEFFTGKRKLRIEKNVLG